MATFTLIVRPDGRAILASKAKLTDLETEAIQATIASWETFDPAGVLLLDDIEVVQITAIELDLALTPAGATS